MKHIRKFNENKSDVTKEDLIRFVSEIRECCLDFEDEELIYYSFFSYKKKTINGYLSIFKPNNNFDRWIDSSYVGLPKNSDFGILLVFKIPEVKKEWSIIGHDGISRLEDIINISRRLENLDFEVELNLDGKHHQYKPIYMYVMYPDF